MVAAAGHQAEELLAATRMQAQQIIDEAHEAFQVVFAASNKNRHVEALSGGDLPPQGVRGAASNGTSPQANGAV